MIQIVTILNIIIGLSIGSFLFYGAIVSLIENELKVSVRLFFLTFAVSFFYIFVLFATFHYQQEISAFLLIVTIIFSVILFFPFQGKTEQRPVLSQNVDERDTMFSRNELEPSTHRFEDYYTGRPEYFAPDHKFRKKPGLLKSGTSQFHPLFYAAASAGFETVSKLHPLIEGAVVEESIDTEPEKITNFIKGWAKKLGAVSCGIAELQPYHFYTIGGRGDRYGKPVVNQHTFAIAITVGMDKSMIDAAPKASVVMESAQKYMEAGSTAVQIAGFLRNIGYDARAHIDGNYEVICPLVARDAGLGEIGRMGLLMTPELGPRVRVAIVTTSLKLVQDKNRYSMGTQDFCSICKKCAEACPSNAIPFGEKEEIEGVRRWQIKADACFALWCDLGTDCGRCIAVCPYSHPDNFFHRFVRWGIGNSKVFRRVALYADDFLYGRKPPPAPLPLWMNVRSKS